MSVVTTVLDKAAHHKGAKFQPSGPVRCGSEDLVKNGHAPNGKQKYDCKNCGKASRENPEAKGYSDERKEEILGAYQERSSLRGLTRTFGVSRTTVTKWLKKSQDVGST